MSTSDHIKFQVEPHGLLRLIIKDATPRDVGNYVLKISNPHGEIETAARLVFDSEYELSCIFIFTIYIFSVFNMNKYSRCTVHCVN